MHPFALKQDSIKQVTGGKREYLTTQAVGEEGGFPLPTTMAVGEEGGFPLPTTLAVGEEGGFPIEIM